MTFSLPPSFALKSTLFTPLRCLPVSCTFESVVALCMPPQVSMHTASLSSGGSTGADAAAVGRGDAGADREAREGDRGGDSGR